jgi:hypothetical protein
MDWKSTAVISGAGILATWFFSMPPSHAPAPGASTPAARAPQSAAAVDIQQEAARLQGRLHQPPPYSEPSRNLFRFGQRSNQVAPTSGRAPERPANAPAAAPLPPAAPRITLDGIASDTVGDQQQRTAILNTDSGVVLAREGEQVAGYRVAKIAADAVELVKLDDGSTLRLALR